MFNYRNSKLYFVFLSFFLSFSNLLHSRSRTHQKMNLYTASVDEPNVLAFSNPSLVPETALFSFHPLVFLYFMLSFYLVPYPLYRFIAKRYNWETNHKTMARHWSDTMLAFSYGVILFIFGNYTRTFR